MTLERILDYAIPVLDTDSDEQKELKLKRRSILSEMVEQYKRGEIVNFAPMNISADIEEIIKKLGN